MQFSRDEINTHLSTYSACLVSPASSLPDLVVTSLTGPTSATVGGTINVSAQVRNEGAAAAGAFRVELLLSTDSTITWGDQDTQRGCSFDGLAPGAQSSCGGSVPLPSSVGPGTYYLGVMVDYLGAVIESSDSNNFAAADTGALVITEAPTCTYSLSSQAQSFPAFRRIWLCERHRRNRMQLDGDEQRSMGVHFIWSVWNGKRHRQLHCFCEFEQQFAFGKPGDRRPDVCSHSGRGRRDRPALFSLCAHRAFGSRVEQFLLYNGTDADKPWVNHSQYYVRICGDL